jgi:hypothetical protein
VRERDSWQLLSIGEIPLEKVQKNLRELTTFMNTNVEVIKSIFRSCHPLSILDAIGTESVDTNLSQQEKEQRSAFISYLATLLPYARIDHPLYTELPAKEYRRLLQSFDELERKTVRYIDNTALRLRSEGTIRGDSLMLAYQQEALSFIAPDSGISTDVQYRALQYRLQPFNTLIAEVFPAKLDGLLQAFKTLAEREPVIRSDWEVVGTTELNEYDAHLLSTDMGSLAWEEESHLLIDGKATASRPFSRLRATYYCLDGKRLLREGYAVIKEAVCRSSGEHASRWEEIERSRSRLLPITFFTAIFSTMDWQRDYEIGGGVVDACFERGDQRVLVQLPWADHSCAPLNPIAESERAAERLKEAMAKEALVTESGERAIIIDCRDRISYPLIADNKVLYISFFQLAAIGTTWEGVTAIKDQLGLGFTPPVDDEEDDEEPQLEMEDVSPAIGSSYFTSMFLDATPRDSDDEDEEAADEIFSFAEQPSLFDFDDENIFSFDHEREDDDADDDYEYESEAYQTIEMQEIGEDFGVQDETLSAADEEMESGSLDGDVTYYGASEDDDDADELLDMIEEPQPPLSRFILADVVSRASEAAEKKEAALSLPSSVDLSRRAELDPSLPPTIGEIIIHLSAIEGSAFAAFVDERDEQLLSETASLIEEAKRAQRLDGRDKMFSVPGLDLTIVVADGQGDAMNAWNRRNSVGAMMCLQKKPYWSMLQLEYDKAGNLSGVDERIISAKEFSTSDWKYVTSLAERILEKRRT